MTHSIRTGARAALATALLVAGTLACGGKSSSAPLANDLLGDLEAAQSSSIELANGSTQRTQVVSAEELTGKAATRLPQSAPRVAPRAAPRAVARQATPSRAPAAAPTPSVPTVVEAPAPIPPVVDADTLAPIEPRPAPSRPAATPSRRGGYKSVGDVIRDAPFPINP